ncbi:MAG: hypothetical protein V4713_18950 [Pseudomonadota bacterium]
MRQRTPASAFKPRALFLRDFKPAVLLLNKELIVQATRGLEAFLIHISGIFQVAGLLIHCQPFRRAGRGIRQGGHDARGRLVRCIRPALEEKGGQYFRVRIGD